MPIRRVASFAQRMLLPLLVSTALVAGLSSAAWAEDGWCEADADCPLGESCVQDRCWPLTGGVPERCVSFVEGSPDTECRKASSWLSEGAITCEIAGGSLDAQLMGDSCGGGAFRSALNVCCVAEVENDAEVVTGTNVDAMRDRIEDEAMNKAFGCSGAGDRAPGLPLAAMVVLCGCLAVRRWAA